MEEALVIWIEDWTSHNIPLSQSLIHSKVLTLLNSMKAERSDKAAKEKAESSSWDLRKEAISITWVQGEAATADVEVSAS